MTNTITINGNAGGDGELKFSQSGVAFLKFSLADNESKKLPNGEWETIGTTWFNVTAFGPTAEAFAESIRKGARVRVTGRVKLREYDRNDGGKGTSLDVSADALGVDAPKGTSRPAASPAGYGGTSTAPDPWGAGTGDFSEPPF